MQNSKITVVSISDPTGTTAPSAGANGELGRLALKSEVDAIIVGITGQNSILVTQVGKNQFVISIGTPLSVDLSVSPSTNEIGSQVTGANLTWSINNTIISQSIDNGIGSLPIGDRDYLYLASPPITSNRTFTITANDGSTSDTDTATVSFYKRRFWGTIPSVSGGIPSNSQLLAGNSELSSSRTKTINYNCATPSGGNYFYYCYPTSYGLATATINNLVFSDWYDPLNPPDASTSPATISVTNQYGHVENYYMYRSYNVQNGSSITVVYG